MRTDRFFFTFFFCLFYPGIRVLGFFFFFRFRFIRKDRFFDTFLFYPGERVPGFFFYSRFRLIFFGDVGFFAILFLVVEWLLVGVFPGIIRFFLGFPINGSFLYV